MCIRDRIREDAFRNLLLAFNRKLPKKLYNGKYEFWACDGSSCDIFLNSEDKDTYFEPNGKSTRGFNQIHINAMFSLLDKRFTDILVQPARKRNEYSAFCSMVDSADIPEHSKVIFFGDRGYTSYNNFAHVIEKGQYFLIRCNDKRASGMMGYPVDTLPAFDEDISLILTRSKAVSKYSRPELFSSYPVSYTHLDVYQRQLVHTFKNLKNLLTGCRIQISCRFICQDHRWLGRDCSCNSHPLLLSS